MQVQRISNNNTNFTAIRNVYGKGHFCPKSVESDRQDLEFFCKNRFISQLAKIWDFDVSFTLTPVNYTTAFEKTIELKGCNPNPFPGYETTEVASIRCRSFMPMIKKMKKDIIDYAKYFDTEKKFSKLLR